MIRTQTIQNRDVQQIINHSILKRTQPQSSHRFTIHRWGKIMTYIELDRNSSKCSCQRRPPKSTEQYRQKYGEMWSDDKLIQYISHTISSGIPTTYCMWDVLNQFVIASHFTVFLTVFLSWFRGVLLGNCICWSFCRALCMSLSFPSVNCETVWTLWLVFLFRMEWLIICCTSLFCMVCVLIIANISLKWCIVEASFMSGWSISWALPLDRILIA